MLSLSSRVLAHGDQPEAHRAGLGHWQLEANYRDDSESVLLYIGLHRSVVRHPMYRLNLESVRYVSRVGRARGFSLSLGTIIP